MNITTKTRREKKCEMRIMHRLLKRTPKQSLHCKPELQARSFHSFKNTLISAIHTEKLSTMQVNQNNDQKFRCLKT